MFPTRLTDEQKEHHRQAHRSNAQVANTWQLFQMYLQMDKGAEVALEMAEKAMEVWIPYEDSKAIEYPDIDPPDIAEQFQEMMKNAATQMMKVRDVKNMYEGMDSTEVEADFATEGPSDLPGGQSKPQERG